MRSSEAQPYEKEKETNTSSMDVEAVDRFQIDGYQIW